MILGSVARRYARALFDLALEAGIADRVEEDLQGFVGGLDTAPEVWRTLTNPAFSKPERRKLLDGLIALLGPQPVTSNFLRLLIDNGRIDHLPAIMRELRNFNDAEQGRIRAVVRSAVSLDPAEIEQLEGLLERVSEKTVLLDHEVDPDLIGGMVTQVGGLVFDGSLRTQMQRIRERLVRENA